ncbi:asparaginyl-tRNA synthetase [Orbilia ellipsospora]|uniref:asparagine--tRNA ligase n=1 Tax=Orbilia ellipsospora TaxID=2528407 RepID=A0AAV9XE00_9PEZI
MPVKPPAIPNILHQRIKPHAVRSCIRCLQKQRYTRQLSNSRILTSRREDENGDRNTTTGDGDILKRGFVPVINASKGRWSTAPSLTVRELFAASTSDTAKVYGWVLSIRKMKNVAFATINDGSTTQAVQVVLTPEQAKGLTIGTAAKITGSWQSSLKEDAQRRELVATGVEVLGESDPATYPLQKKSHTFEYLRSISHLRPKSNTFKSLLLLRSSATRQISNFFHENSFLQTHPPVMTSSDCEGAGEVFAVTQGDRTPFFSDPVYLTVSSQLHLEAQALASSRVWCLAPTFRAEKSDTARHLNEFYMLEAEMAFVDNVRQITTLVEELIRSLVNGLREDTVLTNDLFNRRVGEGELDAKALEERWRMMVDGDWSVVSYTDAIKALQDAVSNGKKEFQFPVEWGMNLQSEHEKYLAEAVGNPGRPVFVTDYPAKLKPFYMLPNEEAEANAAAGDQKTVACFDLLLPQIGEIVGGSMREHRYDFLKRAMDKKGMSEETKRQLTWYLELRRWGCAPHGGFGLGFDRLLAYLAGVENIRETVAFPRWYDRCLC